MREILLIGSGNMALSIAKSLKDNYKLAVANKKIEKLHTFEEHLGVQIEKLLVQDLDIEAKDILLCVKPQALTEVSTMLKGRASALYSILAGSSLDSLRVIDSNAYMRAMPNVAAQLGHSMTTLFGDAELQESAIDLFNHIGKTLSLKSEKELDIATALAGSGPAYLALVAEALSDGAVNQGLKRDDATELVRGLFEGFGALLQTTHPALLKDSVMSAGGTTAAGYAALEKAGVRSGVITAIEQAYNRSKELT